MSKKTMLAGIFLCLIFFNPAFAQKVYEADVVVVGAGAGGTVAAVSAVEGGLKTVLLEKNKLPGGAGNFMEGSFAVGSFMQKEAGIELTKTEAFNRIMAYHHWKPNARVVMRFIDETAETIQWIWDHGVHFEEVKTAWRSNPYQTWHIYPKSGASLINAMIQQFKDQGGTLLLNTRAQKLLTNDAGEVVGVIAQTGKGEEVTVHAKNVILATGGYASNLEMIKQYGGPDSLPTLQNGSEGDGINMALAVGADLDGMGPLMTNGAFMLAPKEAICNGKNAELRAMSRQSLLYVNGKGERFFNEELTVDWPVASNAINREGKYVYILFDDAIVDEFETSGYLNGCGNYILRGAKMTRFDELLSENVENGNIIVGQTLDEVAGKAGMNPQILVKTAANMTQYAQQGQDLQFGKDKHYLRAVSKAPFYLMKVQLHHLVSLGGVKVNEDMQAVNNKGDAIKGLYAIGQDAGGLYGDTYDLKVGEGSASSFAVNGGRISVKHILGK